LSSTVFAAVVKTQARSRETLGTAASSAVAQPTSTFGSLIAGTDPNKDSRKPGVCFAAHPARFAS
jgi:hypothetical protein